MEIKIQEADVSCAEGVCGYSINDENINCVPNESGCSLANLLEAEQSAFHDSQLAAATSAINAVLAQIPPDKKGRKVSFISTKKGVLLAWVDHESKPLEKGITHGSDEKTLAKALKLKT